MLQPVIQFGTAIHGKSFSGGALDRTQKLLHDVDILSVLREYENCVIPYRFYQELLRQIVWQRSQVRDFRKIAEGDGLERDRGRRGPALELRA
jgi:hypothetical protein